jgi:hypothetical protein
MLLIAIAIRLTSKGSSIYWSDRVGKNNKIFKMPKFRSMRIDTPAVATNLLILDETFDSSLDHDGVENLMKILNTLDTDTNVFVISHKGEILDGRFKDKIEFSKKKNFSTAEINSVQDV